MFTNKEEPKKNNLFDKVDLDSNPTNNVNKEEVPNTQPNILDFLNDGKEEVKNSIFLDNDNNKKVEQNGNTMTNGFGKKTETKKKLAFFDDDDE